MSETDSITTFSVIGCGLIGASWAALASAAGLRVLAWDPDRQTRETMPPRVIIAKQQLADLGLRGDGTVTQVDTLAEAVTQSDWIQENAPERLDLKISLLREIEALAPTDCVIASSTSSLLWSDMANKLGRPERFILAHPFNPPHLMPLVEIYGSSAATKEMAVAFYQRLGRVPVCLKREARGHIANRLASALWREAVNIVATGIADVADVDRALMNGPGLRWSVMGAHMAYHLGGGAGGITHYLEHLGPTQERRWADLGTPHLTPEVCRLLSDGIAQEAAGRSIETLEQERDTALIAALKLRKPAATS
jgi:3-hydroxyacyl-CoA dehydrogenase